MDRIKLSMGVAALALLTVWARRRHRWVRVPIARTDSVASLPRSPANAAGTSKVLVVTQPDSAVCRGVLRLGHGEYHDSRGAPEARQGSRTLSPAGCTTDCLGVSVDHACRCLGAGMLRAVIA